MRDSPRPHFPASGSQRGACTANDSAGSGSPGKEARASTGSDDNSPRCRRADSHAEKGSHLDETQTPNKRLPATRRIDRPSAAACPVSRSDGGKSRFDGGGGGEDDLRDARDGGKDHFEDGGGKGDCGTAATSMSKGRRASPTAARCMTSRLRWWRSSGAELAGGAGHVSSELSPAQHFLKTVALTARATTQVGQKRRCGRRVLGAHRGVEAPATVRRARIGCSCGRSSLLRAQSLWQVNKVAG